MLRAEPRALSPSTESYDRGKKFEHYRALESLQEYGLVSQDQPLVEQFTRQPDGRWLFAAIRGLDSTASFGAIDCAVPMAEIYGRVPFAG